MFDSKNEKQRHLLRFKSVKQTYSWWFSCTSC